MSWWYDADDSDDYDDMMMKLWLWYDDDANDADADDGVADDADDADADGAHDADADDADADDADADDRDDAAADTADDDDVDDAVYAAAAGAGAAWIKLTNLGVDNVSIFFCWCDSSEQWNDSSAWGNYSWHISSDTFPQPEETCPGIVSRNRFPGLRNQFLCIYIYVEKTFK